MLIFIAVMIILEMHCNIDITFVIQSHCPQNYQISLFLYLIDIIFMSTKNALDTCIILLLSSDYLYVYSETNINSSRILKTWIVNYKNVLPTVSKRSRNLCLIFIFFLESRVVHYEIWSPKFSRAIKTCVKHWNCLKC